MHRRIHGAQRRPVHGVRGGNVQGGVWRGILHGMSGRLDVACRCYMRWHALEALCLFALMLVDGHVVGRGLALRLCWVAGEEGEVEK